MIRIWQGMIRRVKAFSFRTKLFLSNMILIVIMAAAIGSLVLIATNRYTEMHAKDLSLQVVHQIADTIDYRRHEFSNSTVYLLNDPLLRNMLITQETELTSDNIPAYRHRMNTLLAQFGTNNRHIKAIIVRTKRDFVFSWERDGPGNMLAEGSPAAIADRAKQLLESEKQDTLWRSSLRDTDEITIARYYIDVSQINRRFGILIFQLDPAYFLDLRKKDSLIQNDSVAILDERNEFLIGGRKTLLRKVVDSAPASDTVVSAVDGNRYLVAQETNPSGWKVISMIPMSKLLSHYRLLEWIIVMIAVGAIFISAVLAFYLSVSTTRNIKRLERTMRKVEDGDFEVRITPLGSDEIGILGHRFNTMLDRLQELIDTVYNERLAKQQAQYSVLLAQINPHFLYNTLGTIRWYAKMKMAPDIEHMVASLLHLLKASVRKKGEFHSLAEELAYIRSYIEIQKIGYGDAFQVHYEIDDSLLSCSVLHMTLQPLVENSILHGLEMSKGGGSIVIRAYQSGDTLTLEVEDNGVGMDGERIRTILETGDRRLSYPGLHSIGVRSVNERFRLYYGPDYGLSYESIPGTGTKAILRLPATTTAEEGI
ncbi:sensor histidine kinase [Gorillibacterium sp. sgz5001074]|uniref:sensor histidine kinase n=1 Tax=Gorillibacterium sp. sgz5001074 TaxID=3446695 RepID=UPI003F681FE8